MKPLMLVDGNSLAKAAFHARELGTGSNNTQVPFTFLNAMRHFIATEYAAFAPLVLWDSQSAYRKSIYPEYKANRVVDPNDTKEADAKADYRAQVEVLKNALHVLGIRQALAHDFEADDLAYQLTQKSDGPVVLVTGDRDWLQMLTRVGISWLQHRVENRRLISLAEFEDETGVVDVKAFVQMKALTGDSSDNIPGVGGIGEKGAKDLLKRFGSVEAFVNERGMMNAPAAWLRLRDNQPFESRGKQYPPAFDAYLRNLELVDLSRCPPIPGDKIEWIPEKFDRSAFSQLAHVLAFRSILQDLSGWIKPFERRLA